MKLQINKETKITDIQKSFSAHYPYLKIEFYKQPHGETELSSKKDRILPVRTIGEVSKVRTAKTVAINPDRTVADLESAFYKKFGIGVQVSRKMGNIWIETSHTDSRTLGMQNEQGRMSGSVNKNELVKQIFGS